MLIVVRAGEELSLKTRRILELLDLGSDTKVLRISRKDVSKFIEKNDQNNLDLATSTSSILAYFLLMVLKSPGDIHDGILARLFKRPRAHVLANEGFLSVLSQTLHYYFATSSRTDRVLHFLRKINSRKIFLIDEFWSINTINLGKLKNLGHIIYVSQDVAHNRYGFRDNLITKDLMYKFELKAIDLADLVIACSERDKIKYIEMGAKKAVFYPNIYPLEDFRPDAKDELPSICIVSRGHWGGKADESLKEIFKALSFVNRKIKVSVVGIEPKKVPQNISLKHYDFMPTKLDYLNVLSKSWIGINVGFHMAGSNERKYDYGMAGLVVFSDSMGARGDLLPHEYTYVDSHDLAAKIDQLLQFGKDKIVEMGTQNRKQSLSLAQKHRKTLLAAVNSELFPNIK